MHYFQGSTDPPSTEGASQMYRLEICHIFHDGSISFKLVSLNKRSPYYLCHQFWPRGYKFGYSLKLKIKRNDWLLADTCPQAANHCALFCVTCPQAANHLE